MTLALLLLVCSISVTLQEDTFWTSPYFTGHLSKPIQLAPKVYRPTVSISPRNRISQKDVADALKLFGELRSSNRKKVAIHGEASVSAPDSEERTKSVPSKNDKLEDRGFGALKWLGLKALFSSYSASTTTSTTYSTVTSTVTIRSVASCITSTIFAETVTCRRRKRNKLLYDLLVGDGNAEGPISPSRTESIEASLMEMEALFKAKETSSIEFEKKFIIESSIKEVNEEMLSKAEGTPMSSRQARQQRFFGYPDSGELLNNLHETVIVSTSTVTMLDFYTAITTRTVTNFGPQGHFTCVPACVTLC